MRFATNERASTTLALIAETMPLPAVCPLGRWPTGWRVKGGVVANVVEPTPDYVRLASHYGFAAPDFCHASDPQSKGIVENLCGYAQDDLAVPLLTEATVVITDGDSYRMKDGQHRKGATRTNLGIVALGRSGRSTVANSGNRSSR